MPPVMPVASPSILIAFLGLSLCLSISGTLMSGALILLGAMTRWAPGEWKAAWKSSPLSLSIGLYIAWGVSVTLATGSTGFRDMLSEQTPFLLYFLIVYVATREESGRLAKWICVGSVIAGLLALLQMGLRLDYIPDTRQYQGPAMFNSWPDAMKDFFALRGGRAVGTRSHPLTFAETLIPAYFLLLSAAIARMEERRPAAKTWIALMIVTAGIFLAQSRGVWLGCAAGTLALLFWVRGSVNRILLPAAAAVLIAVAVASPAARGRVMSIFSSTSGSIGDQQSKAGRYQIWSEAFMLAKQHPVQGYGIDGVKIRGADPYFGTPRTWTEAHNIFIQSLLERGLVGLGLLIWLLICACRLMNGLPTVWKRAGHGFLAAMIAAGMTESWLNDKEIAFLFVVMIAIAESQRKTV